MVLNQQVIAICTDGNHAQKAENQHGNGVGCNDQMNDQYHHVNELHDEIAQYGEDVMNKIEKGHNHSLLSRRWFFAAMRAVGFGSSSSHLFAFIIVPADHYHTQDDINYGDYRIMGDF